MIIETILFISILLFSVILHEYAHGWVAFRLGDPTAKMLGRLSLNPLKHIDPLGTIIVPMVLRFLHLYPIGWAKPVPINFGNLRNPKRDMIWVALAGPAINITLALLFSELIRLHIPPEFAQLCGLAILVNLVLAIFNLVPIPPLDGSRIIMGILPNRMAAVYSRLEPFGLLIVLVLLNFGLLNFIDPIVQFFARQLGVSVRF